LSSKSNAALFSQLDNMLKSVGGLSKRGPVAGENPESALSKEEVEKNVAQMIPRKYSKVQPTEDDKRPPEDSDKLKTNREAISKEIISTEETYVKEMLGLLQHYLQPIVKGKLMNDKEGTLAKFVGATHAITILHAKMLKDFKSKNIIKTLQEYVGFFKTYFPYLQTYPTLNIEMDECSSKKLQKHLEATAKAQGHLGITQLLILPVQRVPRYVLLLEALDKYMPRGHEDLETLKATLKAVKLVATQINDCQSESENSAHLFRLHSHISGIPDDWRLLAPSHMLVKEGFLTLVKGLGDENSQPNKTHPSSGSVRAVLLNTAFLVCDSKYKYLERVDLDSAELRPRFSSMFDILTGINGDELHAGHTFICDSMEDRNEWMTKFAFAKHTLKRQQEKLLVRISQAGDAKSDTPGVREQMQKINVHLRIRPLVTAAEKENGEECLSASGNVATLKQKGSQRADRIARYDNVFPSTSTQASIFQVVGKETLGALFSGYNIALFAYGNTGAGKTYTMFGAMDETNNVVYHAPKAPVPDRWAPGDTCWGQWTDGHFYMAQILEVLPDDSFKVNFIEYGEECVIQGNQVIGLSSNELQSDVAQDMAGLSVEGASEEAKADGPPLPKLPPSHDDDPSGLIPRILEWLFTALDDRYEEKSVELSYLQVYNNEIQDLQSKSSVLPDLELKRSKAGTYEVQDLIRTPIFSCQEAMDIVRHGNTRRVTRAHKMNEASSRSHAVVLIHISFCQAGSKNKTTSTMYLIDLAGSEAAAQVGTDIKDDARMQGMFSGSEKSARAKEIEQLKVESKFINQSLISLGRVVSALIENQKRGPKNQVPVPYRECKLTHLLMGVLTGEFLCTLILNASPSPVNEQTLLTGKTMAFGEGIKKLSHTSKKEKSIDKMGMFFSGVFNSATRRS